MKSGKRRRKRAPGRPRRYVPMERLRELRQRGLSYRKIARVLGLGYGTVRRALLVVPDQSAAAD